MRWTAAAVALVLAAAGSIPAHSADLPVVVSANLFVPGDEELAVPIVVARGSGLTLVNAEIPGEQASHSIRSVDDLFASEIVGPGERSVVVGVDALPAGTYRFFCGVLGHEQNMKGQLVVIG